MKVLIAEDDHISGRLLESRLNNWGHEVLVTRDGSEAWEVLKRPDAPQLAILDWMMPEMDGVDVCQKVRDKKEGPFIYIILLTAKIRKDEVSEGLSAGADDYVTKPFDPKELRARVDVGIRMIDLHNQLREHARKLEEALANVKQLQGLLPICSYCKKVRDDQNYWQKVEKYITEHTNVKFSHGICPDCYKKHVESEMNKIEFGSGGG